MGRSANKNTEGGQQHVSPQQRFFFVFVLEEAVVQHPFEHCGLCRLISSLDLFFPHAHV
jgi:hypothetical protein